MKNKDPYRNLQTNLRRNKAYEYEPQKNILKEPEQTEGYLKGTL